jgi:hypothetical protein
MILNQFVVKMYLYLKCSVKGGTQNTNFKVINQHKMICVMCSPWKRTFTLTPLVDHVFTRQQSCCLLGQAPLK